MTSLFQSKPKKGPAMPSLSFRVSQELADELNAIAAEEKIELAEVLRVLVKAGLAIHRAEKKKTKPRP